MARTFPAALALVVAVTGSPLPAAAASTLPAPQTTARTSLATSSSTDGPARTWSLPLEGVRRAAVAADPAFTHTEHDDDALAGTLAALSPASRTERFTLAAVSWEPDPSDEVTSIALRVREGGAWSDWYEVGVAASDDPKARLGSEPVIAPGADGVQARVETVSGRTPRGLRIDLVHEPERSGDARVARVARSVTTTSDETLGDAPADDVPSDDAPSDKTPTDDPATERPEPGPPKDAIAQGDEIRPEIVTRAEWGADESVVSDSGRSTKLEAVYVHHTAGSNTYTRAQSASVVRGILRYHAVTLGWPDIGYQFLVDRFGTIYEGRRGSLDELIVGAQAGGFNTNTIGVSAMGNFQAKNPADPMLESIIDVIAWQTFKWDMKPKSKVSLRTGGSTGSGTRWKPGEMTPKLARIRGHRATNYTACPGDRLNAKLPHIRTEVEYRRAVALAAYGTVPAPPARPVGVALKAKQTPVRVSKKLTVRWQPAAGAVRYELVRRNAKHGNTFKPKGGGWKVYKTTTDTKIKLKIPNGRTWMFGVRAVGPHGHRSMVRVLGQTTRPVPSKLLERSKGKKKWRKAVDQKYFRNRAYTTRKKNATITVRGAKDITQVWLIAPSGPNYGRVRVSVGGVKIRNVKMARKKYKPLRRIKVVLPRPMSGDVQITTLDKKRVRISAVALPRS